MAFLAAVVILITVVLPAEYAIDPVGTGRWLGLTDIAQPPAIPVDVGQVEGAPMRPALLGPIGHYPGAFKLDVFETELGPYEYVEYKYQLEQGATMVYSWTASAGLLDDFHGERRDRSEARGSAEESFDKQDRRQSSGSFVAPFPGIHGWYWENPSADPIKLRLTSAGFYTAAVEIRSDRTRRTPPLRTVESLSALPNPSTPSAQ